MNFHGHWNIQLVEATDYQYKVGPGKPVLSRVKYLHLFRGEITPVTPLIRPFIGVIIPFITRRGPPCRSVINFWLHDPMVSREDQRARHVVDDIASQAEHEIIIVSWNS